MTHATIQVEAHVYWKKVFGLDAPSAIVARHGLEGHDMTQLTRRVERMDVAYRSELTGCHCDVGHARACAVSDLLDAIDSEDVSLM